LIPLNGKLSGKVVNGKVRSSTNESTRHPEKIEYVGGIFIDERQRLTVLAMLLENLGIDKAVQLGNLADWKAAIAELESKEQ
jgi:hypothetical protein